jgi:hypothetical protein
MAELNWEHGTVNRMATGHNDVYWCHTSNGPTVVRNKGNVCQLCSQRLADDLKVHSFVVHIEVKG